MSFGDYLENKLLNHFFNKAAFTAPTIYVALSTADPGDDGSTIAEPVANGYARKSTATEDWNTSTGGETTNANAITFAAATGAWGIITHFALFDAISGGNFLGSGPLDDSIEPIDGSVVQFSAEEISVTLT